METPVTPESDQNPPLVDLLRGIMPPDADHLEYEEDYESDSVEAPTIDAGLVWTIKSPALGPDETVNAAIYNEDGRYHVGQMRELDDLPLGHVEISKGAFDTDLMVTAYFLESGKVVADVSTSMKADESLSEQSESCFEFADSLGLGKIWVKAMFDAADEIENRTDQLLELDDQQANALRNFLNRLKNGV